MAEATVDVLMKVVGPKGPFEAESYTQFKTRPVMDLLRQGFTPGQFCELREFSFAAGVGGSMSKHSKKKRKEEAKAVSSTAPERELTDLQKMRKIRGDQINKQEKGNQGEDVDMQPVEFTRVMDSMSTQLFQALVGCETLESISVVKRKATGSANSGDCYLRLDFSKVLVTNLDWKVGESAHVILESCTFIYRKVMIRYRPQRPDGTLDVAIQSEWEMRAAGSGT